MAFFGIDLTKNTGNTFSVYPCIFILTLTYVSYVFFNSNVFNTDALGNCAPKTWHMTHLTVLYQKQFNHANTEAKII